MFDVVQNASEMEIEIVAITEGATYMETVDEAENSGDDEVC